MQLYEAAGELALFGLLCLLRPRLRRRPGALLLCYLGLYALLRFVVEIFRGDLLRGFPIELATPRLAAWLGLPPAEPIFFSAGQLGSLLTGGGRGGRSGLAPQSAANARALTSVSRSSPSGVESTTMPPPTDSSS